ncbi:hypothetical protein GCM10023170_049380 [Phytohabitans houttuyneae]|uniref:Uncharacterized protein n=1 Tax=Phytohabitans houttuyneae TaxID=1076126 RepID=A0A6V8KRV5_9ACTN|nr:hypothetical protein Phou_091990 [Phytohabitans houttuyneae]
MESVIGPDEQPESPRRAGNARQVTPPLINRLVVQRWFERYRMLNGIDGPSTEMYVFASGDEQATHRWRGPCVHLIS